MPLRWTVPVVLGLVFGFSSSAVPGQVPQPPSEVTTLTEEELPPALVLGDWAIFLGSMIADEASGTNEYMRKYGIDPDSQAPERLLDLFHRFSERFTPAELATKYRKSARPEEVVRRQWRMERARFLGTEIGHLFRALEASGTPIDLVVARVLDSGTFKTSRTYINEAPDPDLLRAESVALRDALFQGLGRGLDGMGDTE